MMAKQHVNFAIAAYLGIVGTLGRSDAATLGPVTVPEWVPQVTTPWFQAAAEPHNLLLGAVIAGAFALSPDLDHPNSTITKKLGAIGKPLSYIVRTLSGGHRKGAHSWIFVTLAGVLAFFFGMSQVAVAILAALSLILISRLVLPFDMGKSRYLVYALSAGLVALTFAIEPTTEPSYWVIMAVAGGVFLHDLGDMLTVGKVQFFWPLLSVGTNVPIVGRTNGAGELYVVRPLLWFLVPAFTFVTILYPVFA